MLDLFLETAYEREKKAEADDRIVDLLTNLPNEELVALGNGTHDLNKVAFCHDHEWLEKFKGSPLMDQALELEQQSLQLEMQRKDVDQQRREMWQEQDRARDELSIQRRMLDLELAKVEAGLGGPEEEEEEEEELDEEEVETEPAPPSGEEVEEVEEEPAEEPAEAAFKGAAAKAAMLFSFEKMARSFAREDFAKEAADWQEVSPYFWGHSLLNPLPGSGFGAGAGGSMVERGDPKGTLKGGLYGAGMGGAVYGLRGLHAGGVRGAGTGALLGALGGAAGGAHAGHGISKKQPKDSKKKKDSEKKASVPIEKVAFLPQIAGGYFGHQKAKEVGEGGAGGAARGAGGALLGQLGGGVAGGLLGSAHSLQAGHLGALAGGLGGAYMGYKALTNKYDKKKAEAGGEKAASARFAAHIEEAGLKKEALGGATLQAMKSGITGAGKFIANRAKSMAPEAAHAFRGARAGGKGVIEAGQAAGKAVQPYAKASLQQAGRKAGKFIQENPAAAAGLGAAGLGTAYAAG